MGTFISKFNINDTAYKVNTETMSLDTVVVTDIRIRQSINIPGSLAAYIVNYRGRTTSSIKDFDENELLYLDEAKSLLGDLMSQKLTKMGSIN